MSSSLPLVSSKDAGDVAPNVASLPLAHQVLEKYIRALGGEAAIQKVSSRIEEGTFTVFGKLEFPVEVFAKAPDKRVVVMHMPNGDSTAGFDGHIGWLGSPGRPVREMSGAELGGEKLNAEFYFPVRLRQILSEVHVELPDKISGHEVNIIAGRTEGLPLVRLYFDKQSGLLVRLVHYGESPLGHNPTRIDYGDYRDEDGLKIPCRWVVVRPEGRFTIQITQVKQNTLIDDRTFAKQ